MTDALSKLRELKGKWRRWAKRDCDPANGSAEKQLRDALEEIGHVAHGDKQVASDDTAGMEWIARRCDSALAAILSQPEPSARLRINYAFELIRMGCTVTMFSLDEMNAVVQRAMLGEFDKDIWQPLLADHKARIVADAAPKPQPEPQRFDSECTPMILGQSGNMEGPKFPIEITDEPQPEDCEWMSFARGGQGYCRCGHLGSQQNMVPYAAYEAHLQGNPNNPKTSQPEPPYVIREYECGCSANGPGNIPKHCPEHGQPTTLKSEMQEADKMAERALREPEPQCVCGHQKFEHQNGHCFRVGGCSCKVFSPVKPQPEPQDTESFCRHEECDEKGHCKSCGAKARIFIEGIPENRQSVGMSGGQTETASQKEVAQDAELRERLQAVLFPRIVGWNNLASYMQDEITSIERIVQQEIARAQAPQPFSDHQIKHMVNRFLGWRLPENFNPDAGISFKRTFNENTQWPMKHEPTGTNLFDATQAEEMIRYLIEGLVQPPSGGEK